MLVRNARIHTVSETKRHEIGNGSSKKSNARRYANPALTAARTSRRRAVLSALMSFDKLNDCFFEFI
jgi:hypothetical protein